MCSSWSPDSQRLWLTTALAAAFSPFHSNSRCSAPGDACHPKFLLKTLRCFLAPFQLHPGKRPSLEMSRNPQDLNSGFDLRSKSPVQVECVPLEPLTFHLRVTKTEIITFYDFSPCMILDLFLQSGKINQPT